ncbi:hypothetical protein J27TS8_17750 [Robertmurraya siralis]|uniref:Uncharacterized protein n=1 Tax=Robertmurraya siralis TaxID=77777 RepID=A0A919WHD4_9BACI|nr:hypothetical protein [Robertmurraya siralis]PAE18437.1 hypothetical protein CHH80_21620 [Bacillus sp. 7504-2]GIN61782.1 hypothetical protein J27TS8_17750 [Robertmurraya siralis]
MDTELLFQRIENMIISSTKSPKYISFSSVKMADLFGVKPIEIEREVQKLVEEGRLIKTQHSVLPSYEVYMLPS